MTDLIHYRRTTAWKVVEAHPPLPEWIWSIQGRRCRHCGCLGYPRIMEPGDLDADQLSHDWCAPAHVARLQNVKEDAPDNTYDDPELFARYAIPDAFQYNDDGSHWTCPKACQECRSRESCDWDGWIDFFAAWVGVDPASKEPCYEIATTPTAPVAIALAMTKSHGRAYARFAPNLPLAVAASDRCRELEDFAVNDDTIWLYSRGHRQVDCPRVEVPSLRLVPDDDEFL